MGAHSSASSVNLVQTTKTQVDQAAVRHMTTINHSIHCAPARLAAHHLCLSFCISGSLAVESARQSRMLLAGHVALFENFVQAYATMARERCFMVGIKCLPYFLVGLTILAT